MSRGAGTPAAPASEQTSPAPAGRPRGGSGPDVRGLVERWALLGLLIGLFLLCVATIPAFRSVNTLTAMLGSQAIVLMLALVATIVFRAGDFDLSIAAIMVASACIVAEMSSRGMSPAVVLPVAILFGAAVGLLNGFLVVVIGVDSFVSTLGVFTAVSGVAYAITDNQVIGGVPDFYVNLARSKVLDLPMIAWYAWILAIVLWYVYERTPLGRYLLFVGGNRDAARLAGLSVTKLRMGTFLVSGTASAAIGVLLVGYLGAMDPGIATQYLLAPFAAVFLGATAITVGRFNALGTVIALYLLMVGITALQILGAEPWVSNLFNGAALVIAVSVAKLASRDRTD